MAREKRLKICEICGKEYMGSSRSKTCSDACRKEQNRMTAAIWEAEKKRQQNRKQGMSDLARDNEEARKLGLSYGQYREKLRCEEERAKSLAKKEMNHGKIR